MAVLFENATEDGDYNEVAIEQLSIGILQIAGTWNGATVTIKGKVEGASVYTEPDEGNGQFISDTLIGMVFVPGNVRATISGAGASTNLSANFQAG